MEQCRHCGTETKVILDLGRQPIANALLSAEREKSSACECTFPLKFLHCEACGLYQSTTLSPDLIFGDNYPYMTSVARTYVDQCNVWAQDILKRVSPKRVLEIGCNDGHLLKNFIHLDHLGIDPSSSVTKLAKEKGLNVQTRYWGLEAATDINKRFDLIIANNVLAHVPNLNDFIEGIKYALDQDGVFIFEIPSVKTLIDHCQFDTIYHEHYSHFSKNSLIKIFGSHDLKLVHFDILPSHGGSLRGYVAHITNESTPALKFIADEEIDHTTFSKRAKQIKMEWLFGLSAEKQKGKTIAAFGAAAKGAVFLNYIGLDHDFIDFCVDESPLKQGRFIPGTGIPIVSMEQLKEKKPDIIVILPWNFKTEIVEKLKFTKEWGCRLLTR